MRALPLHFAKTHRRLLSFYQRRRALSFLSAGVGAEGREGHYRWAEAVANINYALLHIDYA